MAASLQVQSKIEKVSQIFRASSIRFPMNRFFIEKYSYERVASQAVLLNRVQRGIYNPAKHLERKERVIFSVLINAFEQVFAKSRGTQLSEIKAVQVHNKFNIFFKTETHIRKRINMYVFDICQTVLKAKTLGYNKQGFYRFKGGSVKEIL